MKRQQPEPGSVVIPRVKYEGGHPGLGDRAREGAVRIDAKAVAIYPFDEGDTIPMWDIESCDIADLPPAAKSKVPWVLLFGWLGLAAKGSISQSGMTVRTRDGNAAYFTVTGMTSIEIRAQLGPLLRTVNVPLRD
jgi:hypothetical protein